MQALTRLKDHAFASHYAGDAATVNHCCAIAIDRVNTWSKDGEVEASDWLDRVYWAYALAIYWLVDDYMRDYAEKSFNQLVPKNMREGGIASALDTVLFLVRESLAGSEASLQKVSTIDATWIGLVPYQPD